MARRQLGYLVGITLLSILALVATIVAGNTPLLGLDLQGGVSVRYRVTEVIEDPIELQERIEGAVEVIRNRVDGLGVAEPEIQAEGDGILVSLPGVDDQQRALDLVGDTATMRFRPVLAELPIGSTDRPDGYPEDSTLTPEGFTPIEEIEAESTIVVPADPTLAAPARYLLGPTGMTGEGLSDANALFDGFNWVISVDLESGEVGEDSFRRLTEACFFGDVTLSLIHI